MKDSSYYVSENSKYSIDVIYEDENREVISCLLIVEVSE